MEESQIEKKKVSYSQYSNWYKCPYHWYLDFPCGKRLFDNNINTCFGTAIHEVIQLYVKTLYTKSVIEADALELFRLFKEKFELELKEKNVKYNDIEFTDFVFDGEDILKCFSLSTNRIKNFPSQKYEFIGTEVEIELPIKNNIKFIAYIDLILKEKNRDIYKIIDIKTSTNGWNSYMKDDQSKVDQLLLYKALYSKQFNVPLKNIEIEFFILKRKLFENVNYPQSHIQNFIPTHNDRIIAKTINSFIEFIDNCFTETGDYQTDIKYFPKNPGNYKKNCKYCPHKKINCDAKETKDI